MTDSRWDYFAIEELQCHGIGCCGGKADMDHDFMVKIIAMRRELGFPFTVTSAYRCPIHNSRESSTGRNGPHTTGHAMDILCRHENGVHLFESAYRHGMRGFGVKQNGIHRFIHLDDIPEREYLTLWSY